MISQKKAVIFVMKYENMCVLKKIAFTNGVTLDLFPNIQQQLYTYRQNGIESPEKGGLLIGYENVQSRNITLTQITKPQAKDKGTRASLKLSAQHKQIVSDVEEPYGYMGTWHTHPSNLPIPSSIDLEDWQECCRCNDGRTSALIFIILGIEGYRIWLIDSETRRVIEGTVV